MPEKDYAPKNIIIAFMILLIVGFGLNYVLNTISFKFSDPHKSSESNTSSFFQAAAEANPTYTIDYSNRRSSRELLKVNVVTYILGYVEPEILETFLTEQDVGTILLHPNAVIYKSKNLEDLRNSLKTDEKTNNLVRDVTARGGRIELVIANNIPKWLSSDPNNEKGIFGNDTTRERVWHCSPPKDYNQYQELVKVIVNHFSNTLNGNMIYTHGSEPGAYFVGSEQEFLTMYKYFVRGVHEADPHAKVGGPMPSNYKANEFTKDKPYEKDDLVYFEGSYSEDQLPIIQNFIAYANENNLPIDHISFHQYPAPSPIPQDTATWIEAEKDITSWLTKYGYRNVELLLDDWPIWNVAAESDTEYQAAFVASGLASIAKNTERITPVYLGIQDIGAFAEKISIDNVGFVGGTGLFTRHGIKKPIYNFYSMLSKMKGDLVDISSNDDFSVGLASADEDGLYILLTNYIPEHKMITRNNFGITTTRDEMQKSLEEGRNQFPNYEKGEILKMILEGLINVEDLNLSHKNIKVLWEKQQALLRAAEKRRYEIVEPTLIIKNIPKGIWKIEEYVIDNESANSFALKDQIAKKIKEKGNLTKEELRALVEEINQKTGLESGKTRDGTIKTDGSTFELTTTQKPNSVSLIVLSKILKGE